MGLPVFEPQVTDASSVPMVNLRNFIAATTKQNAQCIECGSHSELKCHLIDIPNFKDMVLTILNCQKCGFITNGIRTGDQVSEKGRKTTLHVTCDRDMRRDIIKSDSCSLTVVELDLELTPGTLGTQFTTISNLLNLIKEDLSRHVTCINSSNEQSTSLGEFLVRLESIVNFDQPFTLVLNDDMDNSYIETFEDDYALEAVQYEKLV